MNGIKEVKRFQTSDGTDHESQLEAVTHQQSLDIRAIFQSDDRVGKSQHMTQTEAAKVVVSNIEAFQKTISKYKAAINRIRKNSAPAASVK